MKRLLTILVLLVVAGAFGGEDGNVTVNLNEVSLKGDHSNMWFECTLTIHNGMSTTFSATNLFYGPPGLALKISDLGGKELNHVYADPYINSDMNTAIIPPGNITFKEPYGLAKWPPVSLPESVQTVRVRLDGKLSYTGYTNHLTSGFVEVHVP